MNALRIQICPRSQTEPAFPEFKAISELKFRGVAILGGGMASGKTSLGFILEDAAGGFHVAQLTGNLFEGLVAAYNGANERFSVSGN